ncbi:hypothetical protein [Paenibacillus sedimenti]|uniref:hypothetical protein n=1 Tax=Paenibacillus sedimenti TaxID=2770274 RepID=UPI00165F7893|nr:hypothetical protein [Paenibacillus sedimenti]
MTGIGSIETAKAAVSPLITSYKPQVVNADANVSYTDANGNTISGILHHPGIAMSMADLDNMRDHVRAGDEPWNTAFNAFAADSQSSKTPRILYENVYIFRHIQGPWEPELLLPARSLPLPHSNDPRSSDAAGCQSYTQAW